MSPVVTSTSYLRCWCTDNREHFNTANEIKAPADLYSISQPWKAVFCSNFYIHKMCWKFCQTLHDYSILYAAIHSFTTWTLPTILHKLYMITSFCKLQFIVIQLHKYVSTHTAIHGCWHLSPGVCQWDLSSANWINVTSHNDCLFSNIILQSKWNLSSRPFLWCFNILNAFPFFFKKQVSHQPHSSRLKSP